MLRDLDLNRQNCNFPQDDHNINKIPLTNEHGDMFLRNNEYDDCAPVSGEDGYGDYPPNQHYYNNQRPSPGESDYFYDQYVDYPLNETMRNQLNNTLARLNQTLPTPYVDFNQNKFNQELLPLPPSRPPPPSQFTFFGHPLPSLTLGNVWGTGRTASNRATSAENGSRGKGRVQIFRPGDPELQVIVNQPNNDLDISDFKNREPAASDKKPVVDSLDKIDEKFYRPYPYFQTPFSQPQPEKGFSPLIPGMSVGGFIPIMDPTKNSTKEETNNNNDWPKDEDFKEVQLMTKPDTQSKRTPTIEKIERTASSSTISHLATSISPILSTLSPRDDLITEKVNNEDLMSQEEVDETSQEYESPDINKFDKLSFDREIYHQNQETTPRATSVFSSTYAVSSTTENIATESETFASPITSSTTESEPNHESTRESAESIEETFDNFNTSSSLSADHLVAPGSTIPHDLPYKSPIVPVKAGKITKVVSPSPALSSSNEISKLSSPFHQQQQTSEPPTSFDNEYQPNQIFTQTFTENERISEAPQYEREDMEWYFNNYNQSQSNPILNYNRNDNLQAFGNSEPSSATKLNFTRAAVILIVIRILML